MRRKLSVLLVLVALLVVGCVTRMGGKFDASQAQFIEKGKTTKAWVLEKFGPPESRQIYSGTETWIYNYTEVDQMQWGAIIGVYKLPKTNMLMISFSGDVVTDYSMSVSGQ